MSTWAAAQKPFFFLIDFEMQKPVLCPLEEAKDHGFIFDIKGFRNFDPTTRKPKPIPLSIKPVAKETYTHAYQRVIDEIYKGNSFLLNLTFPCENFLGTWMPSTRLNVGGFLKSVL